MEKKKKPWTKPVLRRLEPTPELLNLLATHAKEIAVPSARRMK
jgi:hypothetical protein